MRTGRTVKTDAFASAGVGRTEAQTGRRSARGVRRRVAISLGREAVVILVFTLVALIVASHVWGYHRGRTSREKPGKHVGAARRGTRSRVSSSEAPAQSGQAEAARTLHLPAPSEVALPCYTLRIISAIPLASARRLRDDLRAMGYDAFIYRTRSQGGYTVNVGRFATDRTAEARALKDKFNRMVYRNDRQFESCYFVKIESAGRIEP